MIEVNGKTIAWEEGLTVEAVLRKMNYTFPKIVVKVNGELVEKQQWPTYSVPDQAIIQARHLIAGG